ncbi:competence protein ComEA helix-hairpin-helix repeat protein [Paenibacillus curdlanolyticus YK9]|uniref:Competence protein ComEA helix-hairpin-helix repeat protein n=1 Tax=Paenibacillus curdlanolyticus YK9 TaxID=717606 RepID=E0I352_9BACL|nr:ComEA family DNA-binding protein [Paenibacillus curdlanolyticus]EFM12716.1 competence protein ComEA helix-hairpin-helix repeat protein [Paenibacillus curdlanolyticus YK9]
MHIIFHRGNAMFTRRRKLLVLFIASAGLVLVGLGLWKMDAGQANSLLPIDEGLYAAIQDAQEGKTVVGEPSSRPPLAADANADARSPSDEPALSKVEKPIKSEVPPANDGRIDINRANAEELDALPGIGPAKAAAIVADRERNGAFRSVEELDRVKGIGLKMVEKLREHVVVLP